MKILNRLIEYSFYCLFLFVPLVFVSSTSELFEFNKMWLTFILTIIIATSWIIKMIRQRRILIQRTPLDIPILLFLLSQLISTFHSLDTYVSIWGYYSRFNGGLLSHLSYIILYYAFVSNFTLDQARGDASGGTNAGVRLLDRRGSQRSASAFDASKARLAGAPLDERAAGPRATQMVKRLVSISLISGLIVALWGLPSHFGYDPTCFLFRGTFDVSCWTNDFQPKVRIFSTLGQPDWLGAYLAILLPISIVMFLKNLKSQTRSFMLTAFYFLLSILFYLDLMFTGSKSAFLGFWAGAIPLFFIFAFVMRKNIKSAAIVGIVVVSLMVITLFAGQSFLGLDKYLLIPLKTITSQKTVKPNSNTSVSVHTGELGGTDSGKIRLIVWKGALDIWRHNPIFGTGVETFAFAYYRYKPKEHNLTSEWDFLYNKAHNEYLNYLATTGAFGLGSYLLLIGSFLLVSLKRIKNQKSKIIHSTSHSTVSSDRIGSGQKQAKSLKDSGLTRMTFFNFGLGFELYALIFALLASYIAILVSNFFGFSVVIINLYFFLIPAFVFILTGSLTPKKNYENSTETTSLIQQFMIIATVFVSIYLIYSLAVFWVADTNYALGYNLDHANQYQTAYPFLQTAVSQRPNEPVFQDELSQNEATLALLSAQQKEATQAALLTTQAITLSNNIVSNHPNNVVFWKSRTRVFYILSQFDPQYMTFALQSLEKAYTLAPTDVKISYDLGVLYGQTGNDKKAIKFLKHTICIKPDYRNAYYALGLFYHDMAINKSGKVVNRELQKKAVLEMNEILTKFSSSDAQVKKTLQSWQ